MSLKTSFFIIAFLFYCAQAEVLSQIPASNQKLNPELTALIEAERAFAKAAGEIGVNDSFLKYFAADGVNFQPHPVVISNGKKEVAENREQPKIIFGWEPIYADISRDGDLGYTTGPYEIRENTSERKLLRGGFYFSVWQKQPDKTWKVLLDMGVATPPLSAAETKLVIATQVKTKTNKTNTDPRAVAGEIDQIEEQFSTLSDEQAMNAYEKFVRVDARLHRFGLLPVLGKAGILRHVSEKEPKSTWKTVKSGVSASADLAWSYGTYKLMQENSADDDTKKGYYLRVWRRDAENRWSMVAEITNPLKL